MLDYEPTGRERRLPGSRIIYCCEEFIELIAFGWAQHSFAIDIVTYVR
jgi:hypothetical protein